MNTDELEQEKRTSLDLWLKVSKKYLEIMNISTDERPTQVMMREYNRQAENEFIRLLETGEEFKPFNPYPDTEIKDVVAPVDLQNDLVESNDVKPESLDSQVQIWKSSTEKDLVSLAQKSKDITITGHTAGEKEGFKLVKEFRLSLKNVRVSIEKRRKELKADIVRVGSMIDDTAKHLSGIIEPEEGRLKFEEDQYTAKIEAAKAKLEQEAKARLNARLEQLRQLEAPIDIDKAQYASVEDWNEHIVLLSLEKKDRDDKKAVEEQADQVRKDAEYARLADEQKKLDKQREEQRIEAQRIDDEKKDIAAKQKAIDDEIKRKADADAAEQSRKVLDELNKKYAAKKAKEEADELARIESEKPDLEKAKKWVDDLVDAINSVVVPEIATESIRVRMDATANGIIDALRDIGESK